MTAAASDSSSPTTANSQSRQRTGSCTSGQRTSAGPTVALQMELDVLAPSLQARSRCVSVRQFETRLTGVVLSATQSDRLRLHHRRRIWQVRTQSKLAYSLCKITISEVPPRFNDPCNNPYRKRMYMCVLLQAFVSYLLKCYANYAKLQTSYLCMGGGAVPKVNFNIVNPQTLKPSKHELDSVLLEPWGLPWGS